MMKKECIRNCIFSVNGTCTLNHTQGIDRKGPECPYKEGTQAAISIL